MKMNNYAVMAQRVEPTDSADNFPTPPWATRALCEHVISPGGSVLEPACGQGHMAEPLREYFSDVIASDAFDYDYGNRRNFLTEPYGARSFDWVITNPPFKLAEQFIIEGLRVARFGVAMLARTVFLESSGRYERLFRDRPPSKFAQFVERVPMFKGRLDPKGSTATGYAWFVWDGGEPRLMWIPPCRKQLERIGDYE